VATLGCFLFFGCFIFLVVFLLISISVGEYSVDINKNMFLFYFVAFIASKSNVPVVHGIQPSFCCGACDCIAMWANMVIFCSFVDLPFWLHFYLYQYLSIKTALM
jgi:hypothetical protein